MAFAYPPLTCAKIRPSIPATAIETKYWNLFIRHDELWPALHFCQVQDTKAEEFMSDVKVQPRTVPGETATQLVPQQEPHSASMVPGNGKQTDGKRNGHKNYDRAQPAHQSRRSFLG